MKPCLYNRGEIYRICISAIVYVYLQAVKLTYTWKMKTRMPCKEVIEMGRTKSYQNCFSLCFLLI